PAGQFMGRTGRIEATPHNDVHNMIGGLMSDPTTAAQDPIFWLHHANIDRLWSRWNEATYSNPTDGRWHDEHFSFFDETGTQVRLRCGDVNDTVVHLDYTYERGVQFPNLGLSPQDLEVFRERPTSPPWIAREVEAMPVFRRDENAESIPEIVGATAQP